MSLRTRRFHATLKSFLYFKGVWCCLPRWSHPGRTYQKLGNDGWSPTVCYMQYLQAHHATRHFDSYDWCSCEEHFARVNILLCIAQYWWSDCPSWQSRCYFRRNTIVWIDLTQSESYLMWLEHLNLMFDHSSQLASKYNTKTDHITKYLHWSKKP